MATSMYTRSKATRRREFSAKAKGLKPMSTIMKIPERKAIEDVDGFLSDNDMVTDVVSISDILHFIAPI